MNEMYTTVNGVKTRILRNLTMSVTDKCNLRCTYCHTAKERSPNGVMSLEEMKAIYDQFYPIAYLGIFGGEPTLEWENVVEFLKYVYEKNKINGTENISPYESFGVSLNTNGTIDVDLAALPQEILKTLTIHVSLDGSEELHAKTRGKGNFEKSTAFLKKARSLGMRAYAVATFSNDMYVNHLNEVQEFINYCEQELDCLPVCNFLVDCNSESMKKRSKESLQAVQNSKWLTYTKEAFILERPVNCVSPGLGVRPGGEMSLRCPFMRYKVGNVSELTREEYFNILDYADRINFNCSSTDFTAISRYTEAIKRMKTLPSGKPDILTMRQRKGTK